MNFLNGLMSAIIVEATKFMRTKILLTAILVNGLFFGIVVGQPSANGQRVIVDPDIQGMIDSWDKGAATNGLVCGIAFVRPYGNKESPFFYVSVINTTTNFVNGYLNLPIEALANISLFDQQGKAVAKTAAGERFEAWTQQRIEAWFHKGEHQAVKRGSKVSDLFPLMYGQISGEISVSKTFQLRQSGDYDLHLRMKFVQTKVDTSGKQYFQTTWLPEVVARVQILPEDITPIDLVPNAQTNPPVKGS
jgi:hypothetical protein